MSLWNAKSVNPDTVTEADIAEVAAELNVDLDADVPADFFQAGYVYHSLIDTFRCVAVGTRSGHPVAIGYLPINTGAGWEFGILRVRNWADGWVKAGTWK